MAANIKDQRIAEETMNCAHCGTTFDETKQIHICSEDSKPAESAGSSSCCYEALTVQALRMRNEVFRMGGMSRKDFDREYLNGIGEYERQLAQREGIEI